MDTGSGFEDLNEPKNWHDYDRCLDQEHSPPSHIYIPVGKRYRHVCPTCRNVQYVYSSDVMFLG